MRSRHDRGSQPPWQRVVVSMIAGVAAHGCTVAMPTPIDSASADTGDPSIDAIAQPDARDAFGAPDVADVTNDSTDAAWDVSAFDAATDAAYLDASDDLSLNGAACTYAGIAGECVNLSVCPGTYGAIAGCNAARSACCIVHPDAGWCPVNGRPQPNAGLVEEPGTGGCPAGMLRVTTFCVDRFEASLLLVNADGSSQPWSPYWNPTPWLQYRAVSLRGAVPQGYISGDQASAACANAGKRLCTDTEWLRACQGASGTTYPYGNTRMPGVCNDARAMHPAIQCFGTSAAWIWSEIQYAGINQLANSLDRTGSRPGCVTSEGAFDMMGNLHEWTSNPLGRFRGGYYVDTSMNGPGCPYVTSAHPPSHWDYSTGFRCCAN